MLSYSMVYGMTPALWVSGSQYNVGNIVLSQIDWQQYIRITNGAGTTDPSADTTNYRPAAPRVIKLIQRGVATPSGSSELVVTVSAFNPARAVLNLLTFAGNTVDAKDSQSESTGARRQLAMRQHHPRAERALGTCQRQADGKGLTGTHPVGRACRACWSVGSRATRRRR